VEDGVAVLGRDICKGCVQNWLEISAELKCPICRTVVTSYTIKQVIVVADQLKKNRKRKRGVDEDEDGDVQEISQIIGIEALSPEEISYLVMFKQNEGSGVLPTNWHDHSTVRGVKVDEFHKRFGIPPVSSMMFKFPTYFEHAPIKVCRRGPGEPSYKCSSCDYHSQRCSNVVTHAGINHSKGDVKELYLKCATCQKCFTTPGNLLQHTKRSNH
jgi:hypothetical protein